MEKSDTILITGAAGLLGSHVYSRLREEGYGNIFATYRSNCDLTEVHATNRLFDGVQPQHVIHCAATVYGIMGNMRYQGESFLRNTRINTNVIEAARRAGVKKITAMGTGAVYPVNRDDDRPYYTSDIFEGRPHPSEAGYAHAKRGMLAMLESYKDNFGMDFAFVVSCNLFGPRDSFDPVTGHVVPSLVQKFYEAKHHGGLVTVWGDGSAQRDFLYVKDAARAVTTIADGHSGAINMGSGSVWRIREIVRVLTKISGLPPDRIVWDGSKPNGQAHRAYDLAPLSDLGFKPAYSIAAGLQETWEWYCHEQSSLANRRQMGEHP